jgi:hypothetical protein
MEELRNAYENLVRKREAKNCFGNRGQDGNPILKYISKYNETVWATIFFEAQDMGQWCIQ